MCNSGLLSTDSASGGHDSFEPPPDVISMSVEELELLTGRYAIDGGGEFAVEIEDERLWIEGIGETLSVFDYGMYDDLTVFDRGVDSAEEFLRLGLADNFKEIPICEPLRQDVGPDDIREEWQESLAAGGAFVEMTPAQVDRYPGEDTLIIVTRLQFENGETFFALDLSPAMELCGWYEMGRAEFEIRSSFDRPKRVPLVSIGPGEFLADGFNYREQDVRLEFHPARVDQVRSLDLLGAVRHSGRRKVEESPSIR